VDTTPIWMMRQAGRSLPAYRKLRERIGLVDITREPELCAQVTLMPIEVLDVDAAIMFADIMLPLAGLGVQFELVENIGPVVEDPIRSIDQINRMTNLPAEEAVPSVLEAIRIARRELEGVVPLIGFSGAPFTLASYLIEGRPTREFSRTKALMYGEPATWAALMERLTAMVIQYAGAQAAAGIQAFQLFDSWIGALAPNDFEDFVLPYVRRILEGIAPLGLPRILFGTGTAALLPQMAGTGADVVGIDWRVPLDQARRIVGPGRPVQGNLDPGVLLGPSAFLVDRAQDVLRRAAAAGSSKGHIFNLGHGVLPESPLDHLKLLVDTVHAWEVE
jgi:uroporphyrinogen decarboxylase